VVFILEPAASVTYNRLAKPAMIDGDILTASGGLLFTNVS